jgi:hypothetical protein
MQPALNVLMIGILDYSPVHDDSYILHIVTTKIFIKTRTEFEGQAILFYLYRMLIHSSIHVITLLLLLYEIQYNSILRVEIIILYFDVMIQ